jgi:phospholipid/cholesterol/gamma-HCH transport system substrate-binding protein
LTLLIFCTGVFLIGSQGFRFSSTYRLNADFPNVAGLVEGADIQVGGIHEGTVHRIRLPQRPDQNVRVEMDLRTATRNVIKKDSRAAIRTEGLVGDQYVEISFGSTSGPAIANGDTIASEPPLQISDMVKKTNVILDSAQSAMKNVEQTTDNLQVISQKLNSGQGTVGSLLNDKSVYQHFDKAAANLQDDTEALKHNFFLRGFFKDRGYEDPAELKRNAVAALPGVSPSQQFTYPGAKLFAKPDEAKLKDGKAMEEAGRFLEQHPYGFVVVASYSGPKGDSNKQRQLTSARAVIARDYLVQHFKVEDARIKTFGGGKSDGASDGGVLQVLIFPPGTTMPPPKSDPPK